MLNLKLEQLQNESDTWKRALVFMMEENVYLKNRIAEVLKKDFDSSLLETIEYFQSRFLNQDERIGELRTCVADLDKLIKREIVEDGKIIHMVHKKVKTLRNLISIEENKFSQLKSGFHNYLMENI